MIEKPQIGDAQASMSHPRHDAALAAAASLLFGPANVTATSDERYSTLRAEIGAMSAPGGHGANWQKVEANAADLIRERGPDLFVLLYFVIAHHRRRGVDGLLTGLLVLARAFRECWDDISPKPMHPHRRKAALEWMISQITTTINVLAPPTADDIVILVSLVQCVGDLQELSRERLAKHAPDFGPLLRTLEGILPTLQSLSTPVAPHSSQVSSPYLPSLPPKERVNILYSPPSRGLLEDLLDVGGDAQEPISKLLSELLTHLRSPDQEPIAASPMIIYQLWREIGFSDDDVAWVVCAHHRSEAEQVLLLLREPRPQMVFSMAIAHRVVDEGLVDEELFSLTLQRCPERGKVIMGVARIFGIELSVRLSRRPRRKILLLSADAENSGSRLLLDEERRAIYEKVTSHAPSRYEFEVIDSPAIEYSRAVSEISTHRPDIVHFGGHGRPDGRIVFLGRDGGTNAVSPDVIAALFARASGKVWLAVFVCCTSAPVARIVSNHVEWSIGFRGSIRDSISLTFAPAVYERIGAGCPVPQAFALAQNAALGEGEENAIEALLFYRGRQIEDVGP